jgi:hypothetical protein
MEGRINDFNRRIEKWTIHAMTNHDDDNLLWDPACVMDQLSHAAGPNPSNSVAVGTKPQSHVATETIRQGITK